jgi:hypothetical protein
VGCALTDATKEADMAKTKKSSGAGLVSRARSAITGRFVSKSTAKRSPKTTVTESTKRQRRAK